MIKPYFINILLLFYVVLFVVPLPSDSHAANRRAEYIYTARYDQCLFPQAVDPTALGRDIAHGHPVTREFGALLQSFEFQNDYYTIEPIHLAYALHVVGERLGNKESSQQKSWLETSIDLEMKDRITSTIYRKYAQDYLRKCFRGIHSVSNVDTNSGILPSLAQPGQSQSFDLYMYNDE